MYQSKHYVQDLHIRIGCFISIALNLNVACIRYHQLVRFQLAPTLVLTNISLEVTNEKTLRMHRTMVSSTESRKLEMLTLSKQKDKGAT